VLINQYSERSSYIMEIMSMETGFTCIPPAELERRVNTIPLPKNLKTKFTTVILSWQAHSGIEWTVSRLKSFRDCLLQSYAVGGHEVVHKPEWFATTLSGRLSGVFGHLFDRAMSNEKELQAVLFLVNIYTMYRRTLLPGTLLSEIKSEIKQGKSESVFPLGPDRDGRAIDLLKGMMSLKVSRMKFNPITPLTMVLPGKASHSKTLHEDILALAGSPIYNRTSNKMLLDAALGAENTLVSSKFSTVVGRVGTAFEPGLKIRYFAAPNQLVQRALEPLKDALLNILPSFPWDCSLDQRKADLEIQIRLSCTCVVHSVDLSKATDNFPWLFQRRVLQHLIRKSGDSAMGQSMMTLLSDIVVEGLWIMPDESRVKWGKGQPLGLGPSFPLFTISHGILLYLLNGGKWDKEFYVLGDDVVIFNDSLSKRYHEVLKRWGVDVSEAKSFSSSYIAQFAGVTYTRTGSFWLPKWVPFTRDNILDLEAWWYSGLTKGLPEHDLINRVLSIPEPYGIGRNPNGIPLDERFSPEMVLELLNRKSRRDALGKPSATRPDIAELIRNLEGLDEGSKYALNRMLSSTKGVSWTARRKHPPGRYLPLPLTELMHGTQAEGYPLIRRSAGKKVDPYSLGSLKSWKQLFRRVDSLKDPV
jgi:hypothetical protein